MPEFVFTRRALFALFAIALVGVLAVHPTWAKSLGADVWNMPSLQQQIRATENDSARLQAEDEEVRQRIAVKEALIVELIAGRTTLAKVTDEFAELDASRPSYLATLHMIYPDTSDRECIARNVIAYVLPRVTPEERAALSSRLEDELHQMFSGVTE